MPDGMPQRVVITEVGPRDGLQNEAKILSVEQKVELIERLAAAGLQRIESGSFVSPRAIPPMAETDIVMRTIRREPGVTYIALVPNLTGAERAIAARVDELAVVVSASEAHNRANINRSVDESLAGLEAIAALARESKVPWTGYVSTAFGCPYEGAVPLAQVERVARPMAELGATQIALGDTIGIADPVQVREMVRSLQDALPGTVLRMHFHDTRGMALTNVVAAMQEGIDQFDGSVGGLGGCPYAPGAAGNVATEDMVYMLERMGVDTGVTLPKLVETARWLEGVVNRSTPGRVKQTGGYVGDAPALQLTA